MKSRDKVQVASDRGMLRLRWTYIDKRYSLSLGLEDTRSNRAYALGIARQITDDIRCGIFDVTRNKYRPKTIGNAGLSCSELFDKFTTHKHRDFGISPRSVETRYIPLSRALEKWLNIPAHEVTKHQARNFISVQTERVTAGTAKARIGLLRSCWDWAIEQQLLAVENPWLGLSSGIKQSPTKTVKPFSEDEIKAILTGFKASKHYCFYYDFVDFLFATGCRFGEAAALKWCNVADDFSYVVICESVSRGRKRDRTKTGKNRIVYLNPSISGLLRERHQRYAPNTESLVFPSPKDKPINDHGFRRRAWKTVLVESGVEYRRPYCIRHSVISHALASGVNPVELSSQTGHSTEMLLKTYAHALEQKPLFVEFLN